MHAVIEIESLSQDWKPPFQKKRETKSVTVKEGETFEPLKDGSPLFAIQSIEGSRILLEYNRTYTLKGYEHPGERMLWVSLHTPVKFSSLWDDNGTTKTVTLREISGARPVATVESPAEEASESHSTHSPPVSRRDAVQSDSETEIYRPSSH